MDVVDLTGDSQQSDGAGPSDPAACEEEAERRSLVARVLSKHRDAAPAQRELVAAQPSDTLVLMADGSLSLGELQADAALQAQRRQDAVNAEDAANRALAEQLQAEWAEEEVLHQEELQALRARLKIMDLENLEKESPSGSGAQQAGGDDGGFVPLEYVQHIRDRSAEPFASAPVVPSVTWVWSEGAWRAKERPQHAAARDYLQIAFISDMHGAQGLLDCYCDLTAVAEADVLCLCGDVLEHERGPSLLHGEPGVERDLCKWLLAQPQRYKLMVAGNHDAACARGEAAALRGEVAPAAGAEPRLYLMGRQGAIMYLQDEAAVITLPNGEDVIIFGTPWHPKIGGLFQYDPDTGLNERHELSGRLWPKRIQQSAEVLLRGSWGVGESAHVVLSHGPPHLILDTINSKAGAAHIKGQPVGCEHLLHKLRAVKPLVSAFGHVHAMQGQAYLKWTKTKQAREHRKARKVARENGTDFPERLPGMPVARRVVRGDDLSDVAAGDPELLPAEQLPALQRDLARTLFVNAANMNATTPLVQHGLKVDPHTQCLVLLPELPTPNGSRRSPRVLRPPVVVRVYPGVNGANGAKGVNARAELVPLGVPRFPER